MSEWHDRHGPDGPRWPLVIVLASIVGFIVLASRVMP